MHFKKLSLWATALAGALCLQAPLHGGVNLIADPGFEATENSPWQWMKTADVEAFYLLQGQDKLSGEQAALIETHGTYGAGRYGRLYQRVEGLQVGKRYEIRIWLKTTGSNSAGWFGGGPNWTLRSRFPIGSYDWRELKVQFVAEHSYFDFMVVVANTADRILIDEVQLVEVESRTPVLFEAAQYEHIPAQMAAYPALAEGSAGVEVPQVELVASPFEDVSAWTELTYDAQYLYARVRVDRLLSAQAGQSERALLTLGIPQQGGGSVRHRFLLGVNPANGVPFRTALAPHIEWLSTGTEDEIAFDWRGGSLTGGASQAGYWVQVAIAWQSLGITGALPDSIGADVEIQLRQGEDVTRLARWMVPVNDDTRGDESLAFVELIKDDVAVFSHLKLPLKAVSQGEPLVGQYWEYALKPLEQETLQVTLCEGTRTDLVLEQDWGAMAAGDARMVAFFVPSAVLPGRSDYRIDVSYQAEGQPHEQAVYRRLSFDEHVRPQLNALKQRLDAARTAIAQNPNLAEDDYVNMAVMIGWRFVSRLEDIGQRRIGQREDWSVLQVEELEGVIAYLESLVAQNAAAYASPRYNGDTIRIEDGLLVAENAANGAGSSEPVFMYGYGHFGTAASDLTFFPKIGARVIQQERGPREVQPDGSVAAQTSIQQTLGTAEANGMKVDLLLSPHYFPRWALDQFPVLRNIRSAGFLTYNVDHPKAREIQETWLRGIIGLVGNNPALLSVCLANEPVWSNSGFDSITRPLWTAFLEQRHGSVAALNAAYGSQYASFANVPAGADASLSADAEQRRMFDWIVFNQTNFANWHGWMRGIIRDVNPDVLTHSKIMPLIFSRSTLNMGIDPELITAVTDLAGNDVGSPLRGDPGFAYGWAQLQIWYDLLHSFYGQPVFNSENHIIRVNSGSETIPPQHTYTSLWQGALHHLAATTIWVWEPTGSDADTAGSIYMRPGNILGASRAMLDVNRLANELALLNRAPAQVALLYSVPSIYWNEQYLTSLSAVYKALTLSGVRVTFISERQLQENERSYTQRGIHAIVLPQATHTAPATVAALSAFVNSGGALIGIGGGNLGQDIYGHAHSGALPAITPVSGGEQELEALVAELHAALQLAGIEPELLYDSTGTALFGVEYRIVEADGRTLVALTNLLNHPVSLAVVWEGEVKDLISGTVVESDLLQLEPMVPVLLEIRP